LTGHTHANCAVMSVDHCWRPTNPGPGVARHLTECQYTTAGPIGAQVKELPDLSLHRLLHWSLPTSTYIICLLSHFVSVLVSFSPLPSAWSFAPPHMPTYHCTDTTKMTYNSTFNSTLVHMIQNTPTACWHRILAHLFACSGI